MDIYSQARNLTSIERQAQYGAPAENLGRIGDLWSAYLGKPISAHDVAVYGAGQDRTHSITCCC